MTFTDKLSKAWESNHSLLMVGLDPDINRFPEIFQNNNNAIYDFCTGIIDATAEFSCGFKPQIAYFASQHAEEQLAGICEYIKKYYPHLPIILDSKRGDIGTTAEHYAKEAFERYRADAVTVNPYMGFDSIEPYLAWEEKGIIILCRTSNPGGSDLQFAQLDDGTPLYLHVARLVAEKWNQHGQCGLVVGATFPNEIAQVRQVVGANMPLLIPGIGAQGGDILATVKAGCNTQGTGIVINSSRAILYASAGTDWKEAAANMAKTTRDAINKARELLHQ
ncbi:orotidine-5'-phosphate decarboxylase [Pelistega ratti]|uniref:orotidine-5'-phosphate decarboxylase n=1 Tax=Pelistega ratti TaxID=2652177 RepID=UPI00135BA6F5|nr:orotidine-5'-phosphate decarboxylase [Pelistega ratti]